MTAIDHILQHYSSIYDFAATLQEEALNARRLLFLDPVLGFNYSSAGVRTSASVKDIEKHIYDLSLGLVKFTLCSHRHLLINIGDEPTIHLKCSNEYSPTNTQDSNENNPYRKIAKVITKSINKIMYKNFTKQKLGIKDAMTSSENGPMSSSKKKMSAKDAIKLMTTSVMSTISNGSDPLLTLLSFYGHKVDNILSDLTNGVITSQSVADSITISSTIGFSMSLSLKDNKDSEELSAQVSKVISALLVASMMDTDLSDKLAEVIDLDSMKTLIPSMTSSVEAKVPPVTKTTSTSNKNSSHSQENRTSAIKSEKSDSISPDVIAKLNAEVNKYQKVIEDAVMIDDISSLSFTKKLGGKLQTCAHKAGVQGKAGFGTVYPLLNAPNKKFIDDLYNTCGMTLPTAA